MADPVRYKVRVKKAFHAHNEFFLPGQNYEVSPEIFDGTLPDGSSFKDAVDHHEPVFPREQ